MGIDTLASAILEKLRAIAQTDTIVGKPISVENATLIPVSKVSVGFGMGGGQAGKADGSGGGGGVSVEPIAFILVSSDGNAKIMSLTREKDVFGKAIDMVPEIVALLKKDKT